MRPRYAIWECCNLPDKPDYLVSEILEMYERLDQQARSFARISNLTCPRGCGRCCDRADTEVSEREALAIAHYLREERQEIIPGILHGDYQKKRAQGEQPCVFYEAGTELHCMIYPARPLICRCYGYSAERDRAGMLYFPLCSFMDLSASLRNGGSMLRILFEPYPPVMADYRKEIEAPHLHPLADAVEKALRGTML